MEIAFPKIRTIATFLAAAFVAVLAAGQVGAAGPVTGCSLIKLAEVRAVLGSPTNLHRGGTASECVLRAGDRLPVILLVNSAGKRGYLALKKAQGPPLKAVRSLGTEAVSYDHLSESPQGVFRGVIVRKGTRVLQLSTSDVGLNPPGLPTVAQLVRLTRFAVKRL
jgi:hypothetical protein